MTSQALLQMAQCTVFGSVVHVVTRYARVGGTQGFLKTLSNPEVVTSSARPPASQLSQPHAASAAFAFHFPKHWGQTRCA